MAIIITYDIPDKHREFKEKMAILGYTSTFKDSTNRIVYLPNTTLYHSTKTASEALGDVQTTAAALKQQLERCIGTQLGPDWRGIYGSPF